MNRSSTARWARLLLAVLAFTVFSTTVIDEDNDCAGFFGANFPSCNVFGLSPVIAKFEEDDIEAGDGSGAEVNSGLFPSVSGLEWSFAGSANTGTWTYNPVGDDPVILFYIVKAADQFSLNYLVPDASDVFCSANPLNMTCLAAAVAFPTPTLTPHTWATATGGGVSHLLFTTQVDPTLRCRCRELSRSWPSLAWRGSPDGALAKNYRAESMRHRINGDVHTDGVGF
jgi:hypothetical protein